MRSFLVLIGIFILVVGGCEEGKKITPPEEHTFQIEGVVVKDLNSEMDFASVSVERDSLPFLDAQVKVNGHLLGLKDTTGIYYLMAPNFFPPFSPCSLSVFSEPDSYTVEGLAVMAGNFEIDTLWPDIYHSGDPPPHIEWSISDSARGYFVSVVGVGEAKGARGYAALSEYNQRQMSIDPSTFRKQGSETLVPGPYVVYVVAYNRSFVSYYDIPFQIPDGLPEGNVGKNEGTFGAGVIAVTDTIWVTTGE